MKGDGFGIAYARNMAYQTSFLIRYTYFYGWNLGMIRYADSLSTKQIAFFGTRHKNNAVVDAEGELSPAVQQSSHSQICQCEQSSSLTDLSAIQVFRCYHHLCNSMFFIDLCQFATRIGCKAIGAIQYFRYIHCRIRHRD